MKNNNKRGMRLCSRVLVCLIATLMVFTSVPSTAMAYDNVSETDIWELDNFIEPIKYKDAKAQAVIENIYAEYRSNTKFYKGSGECYGFAEMIRKRFGSGYRKYNHRFTVTKTNLYKCLKNKKPGTHIRFSKNKSGTGRAHSMVLLKITKKEIWTVEGNYGAYNAIYIVRQPIQNLVYSLKRNGLKNIAWSMEPKGSPAKVKKLAIKALAPEDGPNAHISWQPYKKAKRYVVYRSLKKSSGYKKIATVKAAYYIDKDVTQTGRVYYKIKAVMPGNRKVTSNTVGVNRRVKAPKVYLTVDKNTEIPQCKLTWKAIPGATKYAITYTDPETGKEVRKTVKGCEWAFSSEYGLPERFEVTAASDRNKSKSLTAYLY